MHRREGEPCPRCGTPIRKMRAAGRGTYVCPRCQPRPRSGDGLPAQAASSASSRPSRSASSSSRKPPIARWPTRIWGKVIWPVRATQIGAALGVLRQVDLGEIDAAALQQRLRLAAEAARLGGVEGDPVRVRHPASKCRKCLEPSRPRRSCCAPSATARRIACCTSTAPIAGGSGRWRRGCGGCARGWGAGWSRSPGSGWCCTRGGASCAPSPRSTPCTPTPALRERRAPLERATAACDAVLRLFDSAEPNPAAYNLLCNQLALLDADPAAATRAQSLAFRMKLLLAAGFAPELGSCARCGEAEGLGGFSPAAGGVVCGSCESGSFPPRRGRPPVHGRRRWRARWRRRPRRPTARSPRPTGRSGRPWSTMRTCACGGSWPERGRL